MIKHAETHLEVSTLLSTASQDFEWSALVTEEEGDSIWQGQAGRIGQLEAT